MYSGNDQERKQSMAEKTILGRSVIGKLEEDFD